MKRAWFVLLAVPLAAQQAESPVPPAENWLTGSIDLGYRWRTDVGGSFDAYRSIVNLGSGPKLIGSDFTITDPKHRAFDQIRVRANSWGDEPYSTFHLDARKAGVYEFNADFRDFAYFNYLPSFADPLLSRGITLNEQALDQRRKFGSFSLDLFPGAKIVPYVAYDVDSSSGRGVSAFVSDKNEYAVPERQRDLTNLFRGGVRFEMRRFHATLEQGGTTFKDDESQYQSGGVNLGNVTSPVFGQRLDLTSLLSATGVRGTSIFSKGLFTTNALSWLDVYGQFLYSQPDTSVHYQESATGKFFLQSQLLFLNSQQFLLSSAAKLPHTTGSLGAEIRPLPRLRILESWLTDRLHDAGSSSAAASLLASTLVTNYSQQETNVLYETPWHITLRGGYRYVWGDGNFAVLPAEGLASVAHGKLRRHVGLGGITFRPSSKLSVTADVEGGSSDGAYFRTSLYNYQRVRAQARYQLLPSLSLAADFTLIRNDNPATGNYYDFTGSQESLSFLWSPGGGKRWDFQGSYSRSAFHSDIGYLQPQDLTPQRSIYREDGHTGTGLFDLNVPGVKAKLMAGGSFFISSGSRATSYYQPLVKVSAPVYKSVNAFAEWRYYGYGEALYLYEGFRANLVTVGLRLVR